MMHPLPLNCKELDTLLEGGLEPGIITKIYGEAATGKTNICIQAARECAKTGNNVIFIDAEGISHERLKQICTTNPSDQQQTLEHILFYKPTSLTHQEKIINTVLKRKDFHLLIIDTINMFYRIELEDNKETTLRSYNRQITNLQLAARQKNLYILITEQVYTDKNGEIKPFTHRDTQPMIKTVIRLERIDVGIRKATLVKHRSQPKHKTATFTITATGIT